MGYLHFVGFDIAEGFVDTKTNKLRVSFLDPIFVFHYAFTLRQTKYTATIKQNKYMMLALQMFLMCRCVCYLCLSATWILNTEEDHPQEGGEDEDEEEEERSAAAGRVEGEMKG